MALRYGADLNTVSTVTRTAFIDNMDPFTVLLWLYPTTLGAQNRLFFKGATHKFELSGTTGDVLFERGRATVSTAYETNSAPLVINTHCFLAIALNSGASAGEVVNIYSGRVGLPAVECTYGTATDGSGALSTDAATNWAWFNRTALGDAYQGHASVGMVIGRQLTINEIREWQFNPGQRPGQKFLHQFGDDGATRARDLTGNGFTAVHSANLTVMRSVDLPARPRRKKWLDVPGAAGGVFLRREFTMTEAVRRAAFW